MPSRPDMPALAHGAPIPVHVRALDHIDAGREPPRLIPAYAALADPVLRHMAPVANHSSHCCLLCGPCGGAGKGGAPPHNHHVRVGSPDAPNSSGTVVRVMCTNPMPSAPSPHHRDMSWRRVVVAGGQTASPTRHAPPATIDVCHDQAFSVLPGPLVPGATVVPAFLMPSRSGSSR
jgi:hypothetical protein